MKQLPQEETAFLLDPAVQISWPAVRAEEQAFLQAPTTRPSSHRPRKIEEGLHLRMRGRIRDEIDRNEVTKVFKSN